MTGMLALDPVPRLTRCKPGAAMLLALCRWGGTDDGRAW
jgi:hypothetical protein